MASSSAARSYYQRSPEATPRRDSRLGVVRGIPQPRVSSRSKIFMSLLLLASMVFLSVCFIRIGLTAATVMSGQTTQTVELQIKETSSNNASLSVQKSLLSSPTTVKERATTLGMTEATNAEMMTLEPDVVAYDAAGNLSLSASLANVA